MPIHSSIAAAAAAAAQASRSASQRHLPNRHERFRIRQLRVAVLVVSRRSAVLLSSPVCPHSLNSSTLVFLSINVSITGSVRLRQVAIFLSEICYHSRSERGIIFSIVSVCDFLCLSVCLVCLTVNMITHEPLEISWRNFLGIILWSKGRTSSKMVMWRCAGGDLTSLGF